MNENQNENAMNNVNNNEVNSAGGMFVKPSLKQEDNAEVQEKPETSSFSFEMPSANNVDLEKTAVLTPMENNDNVVEQLVDSNNSFAMNVNLDENPDKVDSNPFEFSVNPNITYDTQSTNNEMKKEEENNDNIVSVKKYLGHMILFSIPVVGFVMLIVKAFSKKDKNISNYAKAQLLLAIIVTVLSVIITLVISVSVVNGIMDKANNINNKYNSIGNGYNNIYKFD